MVTRRKPPAGDVKNKRIRRTTEDDRETLAAALLVALGERAALLTAIRPLIARIRRIGGHATMDEQHALRAAEALVVEMEGKR